MIDYWPRRLWRLVHRLSCLLPSQPRSGSRRKRRKKLKNYVKRCIFAGLMFHFCGCDIAIDTPNNGEGYLSVESMTSLGSLHPVSATFTVSVGSGPKSLSPVSVKASMEMDFFPDRIPESVYLIYPSDLDHGLLASQSPLAAAFVLSVPDPKNSSQSSLFLVTARHAVDPRWANCAAQNPSSIELRLNRSIGGVGYETVQLKSGAKSTFLTSSDPTVDLALIPLDTTIIANLSDYKLFAYSSKDLLTSYDLPFLRKYLPVRTAGYSTSFKQGQVPYAMRSWGSISDMRDNVTEVPCSAYDLGLQQNQGVQDEAGHTLLHLWFINADATAGLIGAPVFVDLERVPGQGRERMLLGIQSAIRSDAGLVGITPSFLLGDFIRSVLKKRPLNRPFLNGRIRSDERILNGKRRLTRSQSGNDE